MASVCQPGASYPAGQARAGGMGGGGGLCGGPGGQQSLALPEKSVPSRDEVGGEPTPAMRFGSGLSVFVQKTLIN